MNVYLGQHEPGELKTRLYIATGIAISIFFLLIMRLWFLQIWKGKEFKELSENNRIRLIRTIAPRGLIMDRTGKTIVENRPAFHLAIIPEDVKDWTKIKKILPNIIDIPEEDIEFKINQAKERPSFQAIKVKDDLTWEEIARVETFRLDIPGIALEIEPRRVYPFGDAASHIIGYLGEIDEQQIKKLKQVNYMPGDFIGKYGIEYQLEKYLRGIGGGRQIEVDAVGREIRLLKKITPAQGYRVYLTIDMDTQLAASRAMKDKVGAVIAMDPQNGKILAAVSSPSFDPNLFASGIDKEQWKNIISNPFRVMETKFTQGQYPPASTFKLITAAAALEDGVITPSTKIYAGESFWFGNKEFRDWKPGGHGIIDLHRAIVESSDTFFYQVGLKVGIDRLAYYAKGFGLGRKTGIHLINEKAGLVPSGKWKKDTYGAKWYEGDTISVSVGQGYLIATPLQMLNAYAAIANGGKLYLPQLIDMVETQAGEIVRRFTPQEIGRVPVSPSNLKLLQSALKGVVNEDGGTGMSAQLPGISVAGKTGTAQVVRLKENLPRKKPKDFPYEQRDHAWFVGFAPAENPEIAVAVIVEHGGFGAEAAIPVAREVIQAYLKKSGVKSLPTNASQVKTFGDRSIGGQETEMQTPEADTAIATKTEEPESND
ncbi:MAG: penicillin-binding protein 2 [Deltaproteobacteria bacterium]|nr:penicillin-binding protein 2 [Deltaproteobacteria bacterium]